MTAEQRQDASDWADEFELRGITRGTYLIAEQVPEVATLLRAGIAASEEAERLREHVCTDNSETLANAMAEIERLTSYAQFWEDECGRERGTNCDLRGLLKRAAAELGEWIGRSNPLVAEIEGAQ